MPEKDLIKSLSIYLNANKQITQDRVKATKLVDTVAKSYLQKQINKNDLESFTQIVTTVSGYKKDDWSKLVKERIDILKRNSSLVNMTPTLKRYLKDAGYSANSINSSPITYYGLGRSQQILTAKKSATSVVKTNLGKQIRLITSRFEDDNWKSVDPPKLVRNIKNSRLIQRRQFVAIRFNADKYEKGVAEALKNYVKEHNNGRWIIVKASSTKDVLVMDLDRIVSGNSYENIVKHFANYLGLKTTENMLSMTSIVPFNVAPDSIIYDEGKKPFVIDNSLRKKPDKRRSIGLSYQQEDELDKLDGNGKWYKVTGNQIEFMNIRNMPKDDMPKSMDDFFYRLEQCGKAYRIVHEDDKNNDTSYILDILSAQEFWCQPFVDPSDKKKNLDKPPYFYDWDDNIYEVNAEIINQMLNAVDEHLTSIRIKQDLQQSIIDRRMAKPRQYTIIKNHDLIALKNGVYNLDKNKFESFDSIFPTKYCFTRKASVNFVPEILRKPEPTYEPNNWSISKWFKQIATRKDGTINNKKLYALYQVLLGCFIGYCWGKKSVFLIDRDIGNTSKSTYLQLIKNIVTKAGYTGINLVQMCGKKSSDYLYRAIGKSVIIGDEMDFSSPDNKIKNSAPFKNIADNGEILIHKFWVNPYSESLNCMFIQAANVFPTFTDSSDSVFNRIYPVMFNHKFNKTNDQVIKNMIKENINRKDVLEYLVAFILTGKVKLNGKMVRIRLDNGFINTGESVNVDNEQQAKQNSFVAFCKDKLDLLNLQAIPVKTLFNMYHNYSVANDFDRRQLLNSREFIDQVERKTHWSKKRTRNPFVSVIPNGTQGFKVTDELTGKSLTLSPEETIWGYTFGNIPFYEHGAVQTQEGTVEHEFTRNGLNKYFDQRRGFKTAEELFDPAYIRYNDDINGDPNESNVGFVHAFGTSKTFYLAVFYKNVIWDLEQNAKRLSHDSVNKYRLSNPSIDNWQTNWLINNDVRKACQRQLTRYLRFLKATLYLQSFIGKTSQVVFPETHDIDGILLSLPKMVQLYYAKHSSISDLNRLIHNYGDVLTPYVYTLPDMIKKHGAEAVKKNCQAFFDKQKQK